MRLLKVLKQPSASIMIFCCSGECHFGCYWCAAAAYDVIWFVHCWGVVGKKEKKRKRFFHCRLAE